MIKISKLIRKNLIILTPPEKIIAILQSTDNSEWGYPFILASFCISIAAEKRIASRGSLHPINPSPCLTPHKIISTT
jgi:hypothetical protein